MKRTQEYLQLLERNTIVSQLSNLFAHEMKQPVTNIINYAAGLQMLRQSGRENGPTFDQALGAISDQAQRIAQIVDRVRAYARHQPLAKTPASWSTSCRRCLKTSACAKQRMHRFRRGCREHSRRCRSGGA